MIIIEKTGHRRHFCEHCQGRTPAWQETVEGTEITRCMDCEKITNNREIINNNNKYDRAKILRYDSKRPSFTR